MTATAATKQAIAKPAEQPAPEAPKVAAREPLPLKAAALEWQMEGHTYREAFVQLPAGMILQDLHDSPQLWRTIQGIPSKALRKFDKVTAVAFDGSFVVRDALVIEADAAKVRLHIRPGDVVRLQPQVSEWVDPERGFVVRWGGAGFGAHRLSDGVEVIAPTWNTLDACKAELFQREYRMRGAA